MGSLVSFKPKWKPKIAKVTEKTHHKTLNGNRKILSFVLGKFKSEALFILSNWLFSPAIDDHFL